MSSHDSAGGWEDVDAFAAGPDRLLESSTVRVRWLPLVSSSLLHHHWLGPTSDGDWVQAVPRRIESAARKAILFSDAFDPGYYYALPLLEFAPSYVRSRVIFEAGRHDLDGVATWDRLPWRGIVRTGLRSLRHQWVSPAMDWVGALDLSSEYAEELAAVVDDPQLVEDVRDRARRFAVP